MAKRGLKQNEIKIINYDEAKKIYSVNINMFRDWATV